VRASMVTYPADHRWSSAAAHLAGRDDALVKVAPLLEMIGDWRKFLGEPSPEDLAARLRRHESTGRPLGNDGFLARLGASLNRVLTPRRPGRKPKDRAK